MRSIILLLGAILFSVHSQAETFTGVEHTYAWLLTENKQEYIAYVAEALEEDDSVSQSMLDLTGEVLAQYLQTDNPDPDTLVRLLRVYIHAESPRYRALVQAVLNKNVSAKVNEFAMEALEEMNDEQVEPFVLSSVSLTDVRQALVATKQAHSREGQAIDTDSIKRRHKLGKVIAQNGYPDEYTIQTRFTRRGFGPRAVRMLEATWHNRVRVEFQHSGDEKDDWKVGHVHELMNFSDSSNLRGLLFSDDEDDLDEAYRGIHGATTVPDAVNELIAERLLAFGANDDERLARYMGKFAVLLAQSGNDDYAPVLRTVAETTVSDWLRQTAMKEEFELHARNQNYEVLIKALNSDLPVEVRYATIHLRNSKNYDSAFLQSMAQQVENSLSTEDGVMVDALALMCKTLAESGQTDYLPTLKLAMESAESGKLRKYAESSYQLLSELQGQ